VGFGAIGKGLQKILLGFLDLIDGAAELLFAWWALALWILFFIFLVRWTDLRAQLRKGGWAAALLLYFIVCFVWGLNSRPMIDFGGGTVNTAPVGSLIEKFGLGAFALVVAYVCGKAQDASQSQPDVFEIKAPPDGVPGGGHGHHGHDDHGHGHGHDDHAHASHAKPAHH
jgi:hypothetical protein